MSCCSLPVGLQCGVQPCPRRLLHQLFAFDRVESGTEMAASSALPSRWLTGCVNDAIRTLSLLQVGTTQHSATPLQFLVISLTACRLPPYTPPVAVAPLTVCASRVCFFRRLSRSLQKRAVDSQQRLAAGLEQLQALTASSHSLWALQCISHMQQVANIAKRLHELSIEAFAAQRNALIRALDVPLMQCTDELLSGDVHVGQPRMSAPVANVVDRWQHLTQRCESELDAAVSRTCQ